MLRAFLALAAVALSALPLHAAEPSKPAPVRWAGQPHASQPTPAPDGSLLNPGTLYWDDVLFTGIKLVAEDKEQRGDGQFEKPVAGPARVELWVESLGRVNYGPRSGEAKGITGGLLHERQFLHGVRATGLRLDALDSVAGLAFGEVPGDGSPGLYRGVLSVRGAGDAVLELPGWTRGFVWVNGFDLGRYWSVGPQRSLYVPGPVLREGGNDVWVLELEEAPADGPVLRLRAPDPILLDPRPTS